MPRLRSRLSAPLVGLALLTGLLPAAGGAETPVPREDLSPKDRARVAAVTRTAEDFSKPEPFEAMAGGAATSQAIVNADAFSHFSANLTFEQQERFKLGNALFGKLWVSSPSSTQASDGLGPLFNARACQSCHLKDGRGHPPEGARDATSMLLRLARPPASAAEAAQVASGAILNFPDPVYGRQLQDQAVPGLAAEGQLGVDYSEKHVTLADGQVVSLRMPHYRVADPNYGPLGATTTLSPRIAPQMIGLGLIEAISDADILAHADPEDRDGDGISGKVAWVRDHPGGPLKIGRFGWKAQNSSIRGQSADAFAHDIGISTPDLPLHWGDCMPAQAACLAMATGVQQRLGPVEAPDPVLDFVTFYSQNLAVPARRDVADPAVLAGKAAFYRAGCPACHVPKFVTRRDAENEAQAFQLIWPYSDFLLHDMGDGLADGQQVGQAGGREWRTPPLWGIGLTKIVVGQAFYMHDGRARTLEEAVLWHGGEAQAARDAFKSMPADDRQALLTFLESL